MDYYDLHVRFQFENYREAGFSGIAVWGRDIEEYDDRKGSKKLLLLESKDPSYLKPRVKRCSLIYDPEYKLDLGIIRAVARYKKVFEVPARPLLVSSGAERAELIRKITRFLRLCNKYGADYALTSRAKDAFEVKHPQELIPIGLALGLSYDQALRSITEVPKGMLGV